MNPEDGTRPVNFRTFPAIVLPGRLAALTVING